MLKAVMLAAYLMGLPQHDSTAERSFTVSSPAFSQMEVIPVEYTCHAANIPFPIQWENVPRNTQSLALILFDPDVPQHAWYHWALYNIPPKLKGLEKNPSIKPPIEAATNSWGNTRYQGPCPPSNEHHYVLRLYALDTVLPQNSTLTALQLREAIQNHIITSTELIGRVVAAKSSPPH